MKHLYTKSLLLGFILFTNILSAKAQNGNCVQCNGSSATGNNASAIGYNTTASGNNSFAGGYGSQASGSNSFAFGYNSKATQSTNTAVGNTAMASGTGSVAIGNYVKATAQNTFVFGSGSTSSYPLTNNTAGSIAFGVNSNKPTMLITKSLNNNYTGKVAIGQVTAPSAKLHIKSDNNEDAGVILEPSNKTNQKAFIQLYDNEHVIRVDQSTDMELKAGKNSLFITSNGKFGFGSKTTFLSNSNDQKLTIQSPQSLDLNSNNITLSGKIGINTVNNVTDYALAVDGGVITTKVFIKEVNQWPDYVFSESYPLLGLEELKNYVNDNKHLPGVPSEKEILEQGYNLNEMQSIMLEKIEEMTRYILMLQDEIEHLKKGVETNGDSIVFSYDANGNRISRRLVFKKIIDPRQDPANNIEAQYDLFPNPTSDQFSIILREPSKAPKMHATLLTASGLLIDEKDITSEETTFNIADKSSGIYILEIESPEGRQAWKVVKQ